MSFREMGKDKNGEANFVNLRTFYRFKSEETNEERNKEIRYVLNVQYIEMNRQEKKEFIYLKEEGNLREFKAKNTCQ